MQNNCSPFSISINSLLKTLGTIEDNKCQRSVNPDKAD